MRRITSLLLAAAMGLICLCQTERAEARSTFGNPWGNVPTQVAIVAIPPYGQYGVFQRLSDYQCSFTYLGPTTGLADDWFYLGSEAYEFVSIPASTPLSLCGYSLSPLNYNGHYVDVYGNGGDDSLLTWYGDTYLYGGSGDDRLSSYSPNGSIYGEDGNDVVVAANGSASGELLSGAAGDDCLEDQNSSAATFDCGEGNDSYVGYPVNRVNCETYRSIPCIYIP